MGQNMETMTNYESIVFSRGYSTFFSEAGVVIDKTSYLEYYVSGLVQRKIPILNGTRFK